MDRKIRVGIVGLGKMGQLRANVFRSFPQAQLAGGFDPNPEPFRQQFPDVPIYPDAEALIKSDLDAILVCTPNRYTPEIIVAALNAGRHVFAEKPPGRNLADVDAILLAEQQHPGCKLMFGFNHRHHASIQRAKKLVDQGELGKLLWLRGIYGKAGAADFESQWRNHRGVSGGGILLDQGIHMLDLMRFFCGDFVEVKSMADTLCWDMDVEDNAFALLRDRQGRMAVLHSSSTCWKHHFSLHLGMTNGYLELNGILSSTGSYGPETLVVGWRPLPTSGYVAPQEEVYTFEDNPSWQREMDLFLGYITQDTPVIEGSSGQARNAMELVHAIYENDPGGSRKRVAEGQAGTGL